MAISTSEVIQTAEHAFLNGKRGTFAIVRTPDGNLWYAAPGVQTEVKFLRITLQDQLFDETSFTGTLIIRSNPKNGDQWFVLYNPDNAKSPYVASSHDEIHDFSLSAIGATLPKQKSVKRDAWSDAEAIQALNACENPILQITMYLALGCSMRLGEILGLQWAQVHMEDVLVSSGEAYLKIDRELHRCSNESIEVLERVNRSTIMFKFPKVMPKKGTTTLVLKAPKTESSNRIVYLPTAVVDELRKVQKRQQEYRALMGDEYHDYDLVVAQMNGHPYEQRVIDKMFYKLIEKNHFRPVVFHSLRHSSTSLKLKLSRGNIKAVQGDTGHAEARMVTDTYAHGFDADRKLIAQEMDSGFFAKVGDQANASEADHDTLDKMKVLIQQHPELLAELLKDTETARMNADKTE